MILIRRDMSGWQRHQLKRIYFKTRCGRKRRSYTVTATSCLLWLVVPMGHCSLLRAR